VEPAEFSQSGTSSHQIYQRYCIPPTVTQIELKEAMFGTPERLTHLTLAVIMPVDLLLVLFHSLQMGSE
jgi:hypothetical protein